MALKVLKDFWIGRTNYKPGQSYAGGDVQELLSKGLIVHEAGPELVMGKDIMTLEQYSKSSGPEPEIQAVEPPKKVKKKKG